jgi:hypothetical protein
MTILTLDIQPYSNPGVRGRSPRKTTKFKNPNQRDMA